jgi:hypothetical protein
MNVEESGVRCSGFLLNSIFEQTISRNKMIKKNSQPALHTKTDLKNGLAVKLFIVYLIYFFTLLLSADPAVAGAKDFRNITWGMTKIEVMASEIDAPVSFTGSTVMYISEIDERKIHLQYRFVNNRLIEATYIIVTATRKTYLKYKGYLDRKYGNPSEEDTGSSRYQFSWRVPGTKIVMKSSTKRRCLIQYSASKLQGIERAVNDKLVSSHNEHINFMF